MDAETLTLAAIEIRERCGDDEAAFDEAMARLREQAEGTPDE